MRVRPPAVLFHRVVVPGDQPCGRHHRADALVDAARMDRAPGHPRLELNRRLVAGDDRVAGRLADDHRGGRRDASAPSRAPSRARPGRRAPRRRKGRYGSAASAPPAPSRARAPGRGRRTLHVRRAAPVEASRRAPSASRDRSSRPGPPPAPRRYGRRARRRPPPSGRSSRRDWPCRLSGSARDGFRRRRLASQSRQKSMMSRLLVVETLGKATRRASISREERT